MSRKNAFKIPRFDANGFYLIGEHPTEREIQKEMQEHPWATRKTAARIAADHRRLR